MTYNNDEFAGLNPMEKKVIKLSIKYQIDLMSMTLEDAKKFLNEEDWQDLHDFMKNGCRERVLH
jgi:hypothetical protein